MKTLKKIREDLKLNVEQMAFIMKLSPKRLVNLEEKLLPFGKNRYRIVKMITKYNRFYRVAKIIYNVSVEPKKSLYDFMITPHKLLSGRRPMDMIDDQKDFKKLENIIQGLLASDPT
jgi:hypothetical protein